jgi:hypothetical protein
MSRPSLKVFFLSLWFAIFFADNGFAKSKCTEIFARIQNYELLGQDEWVSLLKTAQESKSLPRKAYEALDRLRKSDALAKARPLWRRILAIGPTPFQKFLTDVGLSEKYWNELNRRQRVLEKTQNQIFDFISKQENRDTILIMEHLLEDAADSPKSQISSFLKAEYSPAMKRLFKSAVENIQPEFRAHAIKAFARYFRTTEQQMTEFFASR